MATESSPVHPKWAQPIIQAQRALINHHNSTLTLTEMRVPTPSTPTCSLNVLKATKPSPTKTPPSVLILLHGWGAGLALYSRALTQLCNQFSAVYLVDLPGMGGSSRKSFPKQPSVDSALEYFIEDLESMYNWFTSSDTQFQQAQHRHIGAHSMGAYVTVEWMLRRGMKFRSVVLVSPVGVPQGPERVNVRGMGSVLGGVVGYLWRRGVTPQTGLRMLPVGMARGAVRRYVEARFMVGMSVEERELMVEYVLQVSRARGEGERALGALLKPGVWAKVPLEGKVERMEGAVSFVYGEQDWMDWRVGERIAERMGERAWVARVRAADHNVFVDNAGDFVKAFVEGCRRSEQGKW
eukprot:GFKZ01005669.1.p1 GENE.GFKZ01005669.1~~GFKZ01005669.1.p1  ORF type:complete len:376 (-),score=43.30 GFKZ01005669.1:211-1266(-)